MADQFEIVRALTEEDIRGIGDFLKTNPLGPYPNFNEWLDGTLKEIRGGKRYGLVVKNERGAIVGTAIWKKTASGNAELKTFYIPPQYRKKGIGSKLYDQTEAECVAEGCRAIHADAFVSNLEITRFFLSCGLEIVARYDIYGAGEDSYLFKKELPEIYPGEIYDWEEMGRWVLERKFRFRITDPHPTIGGKKFDGLGESHHEPIRLLALLEVKDSDVDIDELIVLGAKGRDAGINSLFFVARSFTPRALKEAKKYGIETIDKTQLEGLTGKTLPEYTLEEIAGYVAPVNPEYFKRFVSKGSSLQVYIKGGAIGRKIKRGDNLLFYVTSPIRGVGGSAKVDEVIAGSPREVWGKLQRLSVFERDEFERFSSGKKEVLAILFKEFKSFKTMPLETVQKILLRFNPQAGCYVDHTQLKKIWGVLKRQR